MRCAVGPPPRQHSVSRCQVPQRAWLGARRKRAPGGPSSLPGGRKPLAGAAGCYLRPSVRPSDTPVCQSVRQVWLGKCVHERGIQSRKCESYGPCDRRRCLPPRRTGGLLGSPTRLATSSMTACAGWKARCTRTHTHTRVVKGRSGTCRPGRLCGAATRRLGRSCAPEACAQLPQHALCMYVYLCICMYVCIYIYTYYVVYYIYYIYYIIILQAIPFFLSFFLSFYAREAVTRGQCTFAAGDTDQGSMRGTPPSLSLEPARQATHGRPS